MTALLFQEIESFYLNRRAERGPYFGITFDGEEASLQIPEEGITLPSGWTLVPLFYPTTVRCVAFSNISFCIVSFIFCAILHCQLLRKDVDNYKPGHIIPSVQVELDWTEKAEKLSHTLRLVGVRPQKASIRVTRYPSLPG